MDSSFGNEQAQTGYARLAELIDKIDDIENLFHTISGRGFPAFEEIHDVQEFIDWKMEIKFELQDIYDRLHDKYVWETINVCDKHMNGMNDKQVFADLKGRLKSIRRNLGKYYPDVSFDNYPREVLAEMDREKNPLIFISHSSKNKDQVEMLVRMLRSLNLQPRKEIFCSSLPGYDIPIDTDIIDALRDKFENCKLHVILIHSPEYYDSPVSLNEMGAAWALRTNATSILLPGFDFTDMNGVINADRISIKLDHDIREVKDKLNQLRDMLVQEFSLVKVPDSLWEDARDEFIKNVNEYKMVTQIPQPKQLNQEMVELLKKAAGSADGAIITSYDTSNGSTIEIGQQVIASELPNRREFAKWDEALKECISMGYIERKSKEICVITNAGYQIAD